VNVCVNMLAVGWYAWWDGERRSRKSKTSKQSHAAAPHKNNERTQEDVLLSFCVAFMRANAVKIDVLLRPTCELPSSSNG